MTARPAHLSRAALLRALAPHLGPHRLLSVHSRDWASALFVGARHRLALVLDGAEAATRAQRLQATLEETELAMIGGFVADIQAVTRLDGGVPVIGIEALTIDEAEPAALRNDARRAG